MKVTTAITELNEAADSVITPSNQVSDLMKILAYWKLVRIALNLVMIFTGAKADKRIKEVIILGDALFAQHYP